MFAIFNEFLASRVPEALKNQNSYHVFGPIDYSIGQHFLDYYPQAVAVNFGESGFLAIDDCPKIRMIESQEDVFCLFTGKLENTADLKKDMKLTDSASDAHIITEMYKTSKKKGEHMVNSSLSEAQGSFSFILYDAAFEFIAVGLDANGSLPMYWGTDAKNNVVFTNFLQMAIKGCTGAYAHFPAGCLYSNTDGLMNFKNPLSKLEPVPWIDHEGNVRGVTYKIKDPKANQ